MSRNSIVSAACAAVFVGLTSVASGAVLYSENFDVDASASWTVNKSGYNDANTGADVYFDYSSYGIPAAPGGSSTRGMMLYANRGGSAASVAPGVSVSPTGKSFTGNYYVHFNLWQNYNGPLNGGGSGSTQITGVGIGTAGTSAQWMAGTHDSVHFGMAGEGGTTFDVRAYSSAIAQGNTSTGYADASGVFAAGTIDSPRSAGNPYYGFLLGGQTAPAGQLSAFPAQTGATAAGTPGFMWQDVFVAVESNTAKWYVNGTLIATVDLSTVSLGGSNILFNHYDINTGVSSSNPQLIFGLIDNVTVTDVVPEPASLSLLALPLALAGRRRSR